MVAELATVGGYGLGLAVLIALLVVGYTVREVLALRLRPGAAGVLPCDELADYVAPLCAATEARLGEMGFQAFQCECLDEIVVSAHAQRHAKIFLNLDEKVYASVTVAAMPDARRTCEVELVSFYADGHVLVTMDGNAHGMLPCLSWLTVRDGHFGDLNAQWALHREASAAYAGAHRVLVKPGAYAAWGTRLLQEYPAALHRSGWTRPAEDPDTYRFGLLRAMRLAMRLLRQARRGTGKGAAAEPAAELGAWLAKAQAVAYQRRSEVLRRRPGGWLGKTALFLLSVILFVLAFGISLSAEMVLTLLGVLLLHELGHVAAMRLFGYRDLQILFVPFLGAAASGTPREPKIHQQLIVALMGPLPGILIGYALMHAAHPATGGLLWQAGLVMLVLNYLNLLPVIPLDGGRVMSLLLFTRYPRLRGVFTLLSALVLGYGAWAWGEPVLGALAVLVLLGVSGQMRIAALQRALDKDGLRPDEPESGLVERAFLALAGIGPPKQTFIRQFQFVRGALDQLRQAHTSAPVAVGSLVLYGLLLVLPPWVALRDIPGLGDAVAAAPPVQEPAPEMPDWDARLTATTTPEQRWQVLMQAGEWLGDSEQYQEAAKYYGRARWLAEGFGPDDPRLARTLVRIAGLGEADVVEDRARLERALAIQERALGPQHLDLAETLEALAMTYDWQGEDLPKSVAALQRALEIRRRAQGKHHPDVAEALTTLAYVYDARELYAEAESTLKAAEAISRSAYGPTDSRTQLALQRLADLYLSHGDYVEAVAVLRRALSAPFTRVSVGDTYARSRTETALGWAQLFQDDYSGAESQFAAALRDHGQLPGALAGDVGRVPLLLDLVYVNAVQERWNQARVPFEVFVHVAADAIQTTPAEFAAHLEQQSAALLQAKANWRARRQQAQARGIRLMLKHES